jgi:Polysaccharide pyruvyl transferase
MTVLVAGWFSFERMGATAGDLLARDLACEWLAEAGRSHHVAVAPPFSGGVDWRQVDPGDYEEVVFVCGPFGNGPPLDAFLERFRSSRLVGLNVSLLEPLEAWDPFDLLWERDSSRAARPDLSFLSAPAPVPVVGIVLVHPQSEYAGARHAVAGEAVERLIASRELAAVQIDTRLDENSAGLRTPREVASLIARVDAVVTTRLHGLALAVSRGVPALAIDPIAGGAKLLRQARAIGWPVVFTADALSDAELQHALDFCLNEEARREARRCAEGARERVAALRDEFIAALAGADHAGRTGASVER